MERYISVAQTRPKPPSLRKKPTFLDATTGFPAKWRLRNVRKNSILMTRHHKDLGSTFDWSCRVGNLLQPIRSTAQNCVVMRLHQCGIFALVSQTSFCGETGGSIPKFRLFSQAKATARLVIVLVSRIQKSGTGDNNFESEGRNYEETRDSNSNFLFRLAFCIFSFLLWVARDYARDHWIKRSDFFNTWRYFDVLGRHYQIKRK